MIGLFRKIISVDFSLSRWVLLCIPLAAVIVWMSAVAAIVLVSLLWLWLYCTTLLKNVKYTLNKNIHKIIKTFQLAEASPALTPSPTQSAVTGFLHFWLIFVLVLQYGISSSHLYLYLYLLKPPHHRLDAGDPSERINPQPCVPSVVNTCIRWS